MNSPDNFQPPLIVTLRLDKETQDYFNALRKGYFPGHLNYLDAHLTLFHHLPSTEAVGNVLQALKDRDIFSISVTGFYHTGFGVACRLQSPDLSSLHASLQETFRSFLIPQDMKALRPHVTVQNKVSPAVSKNLVQQLQKDFKPFTAQAVGIDSWLYLDGPWQHREFVGFDAD